MIFTGKRVAVHREQKEVQSQGLDRWNMERLCELAAESVSGNGMKDDVFLSEPVGNWTFHEEKHRCNHELTADKVLVIGNVHWNTTNQGARPVDQTRTRLGIKASKVVSVLRHITPNISNHSRLNVDYSSFCGTTKPLLLCFSSHEVVIVSQIHSWPVMQDGPSHRLF